MNIEKLIDKKSLNINELEQLKLKVNLEYKGCEHRNHEYKDWYEGIYEGEKIEVYKKEII